MRVIFSIVNVSHIILILNEEIGSKRNTLKIIVSEISGFLRCFLLKHPAGTSKESDKCDFSKDSDIAPLTLGSMENATYSISHRKPILVKIWWKYIYEKICKGMEIRPTLRHLRIQ